MPRNLKSRVLPLLGGVNSKFNAESVAGEALRSAQNVDGFEEFRSLGKVPGSVAVAVNSGYGAVVSLHQFEWTDLDGLRKRHQLELAAQGVLQRIESNAAVTLLRAGLAGEAMCEAQLNERLFLSSPGQVNLPTGGLRYDGVNARNWGVVAPGQTPVVVEAVDYAAPWAAWGADSTLATSAVRKVGAGSVQVNKVGTATRQIGAQLSIAAFDMTGNDGLVYVWAFIPPGALQKLNNNVAEPTLSAFELEISSGGGFTNTNRYVIQTPGTMVQGWNLFSFVLTDFVAGGTANLGAIIGVRLFWAFTTAAQTQSGFLFNFLHQKLDGSPAAIDSGIAGNPTGTLSYRVTFLGESGVESNGGVASTPLSVVLKNIDLDQVPVSLDEQVIARRIYRDLNGDSIFRFVGQIDDNLTTSFTDTLAAASLGEATMPIAGDDEIDHSPPPRFYDCIAFGNRILGIDADNRTIVWVSEIGRPEEFRLIDQFTVTDELAAFVPQGLGLLLMGRDHTYVLLGDGVNTPFSAEDWNPQLGANSFRGATRAKGMTFTVRESEAFLVSDPRDPWCISGPIQDALDAIADPSGIFLLHDRSRYRLMIFDGVSSTVRFWQYATQGKNEVRGDGPGIDPQDLRIAQWWTLTLPASAVPRCAALVERDAETPECWVGCSDGRVYRLQSAGATSWANDFGTEPVVAEFESHPLPIGEGDGFYGRGEPRYIGLDVTSPVASTWEATVTLLSNARGKVIATRTFNLALPAGDSSPILPVPALGSRGGCARLKLRNATAGETALFRSVSLLYVPRTAFSGGRTG